MHYLKSIKMYFFFAVLLFVAKPFLGFSMFSRANPPATENIFVKAFTKRKQEYVEDSCFDIAAIQAKLADPVKQFFVRFTYFLSLLFPAVFSSNLFLTTGFINQIALQLTPSRHTYLRNGKLII
jgi:hypothetical protein